ncbi:MAG: hypothetical protein QM756_11110 [Polyangiaceae bacterium]
MTLLVGIKCTNAVVLAADTAATYGGLGGSTVKQLTRKICIVAEGAAIATSGPVGIGQRLAGELGQKALLDAVQGMESWQAMTLIRLKFVEHLVRELAIASEAAKALGQHALQSAVSSTLVALSVRGSPRLFQFDQQGAPEEFTTLPWVTCGSGQNSADAFVSFLRRIFWRDREPTREEGIFTALWTVLQGIESAHGGIGGTPQVVLLEGGNARELSDSELQEHRQSIGAAEDALANFRHDLSRVSSAPALPSFADEKPSSS